MAAMLNFGEKIWRPGGDSEGAFVGDERGGRGLSIGSNGGRFGAVKRRQSNWEEKARMNCHVRKSRSEVEDVDDVSMTSSFLLFFLFSEFFYNF